MVRAGANIYSLAAVIIAILAVVATVLFVGSAEAGQLLPISPIGGDDHNIPLRTNVIG